MPSDDRLLGRMEATLNTIASGQETINIDFREFRETTAKERRHMLSKIEETKTEIHGFHAKLDSHVGEDNRRFSTLWKMLGIAAVVAGVIYGAAASVGAH